jgi:hypothetical protein
LAPLSHPLAHHHHALLHRSRMLVEQAVSRRRILGLLNALQQRASSLKILFGALRTFVSRL